MRAQKHAGLEAETGGVQPQEPSILTEIEPVMRLPYLAYDAGAH